MTQLKTVIWPDALPAKPEVSRADLRSRTRRAAEIAGLEREGASLRTHP